MVLARVHDSWQIGEGKRRSLSNEEILKQKTILLLVKSSAQPCCSEGFLRGTSVVMFVVLVFGVPELKEFQENLATN